MFFEHFMCTVYKPFHDECLKNYFQHNLHFFLPEYSGTLGSVPLAPTLRSSLGFSLWVYLVLGIPVVLVTP